MAHKVRPMTCSSKHLIFNLLLFLVSLVLTFLLAEAGYRVYLICHKPSPGIKYTPDDIWTRYDQVTGWSQIPGAIVGDVIIDEHGFRVGEENEITRPIGERVISASGDSFTFGFGVTGGEAWPARLERLFPPQPYDVINLGVCAYGIGQMYLHHRRLGRRYHPEIVLVAFMSWDIERVVRRSWLNGREKPRYVLRDGELELTNVPVPLKLDFDKEGIRWYDIFFNWRKLYLLDRFRALERSEDLSQNPVEVYLAEKITPSRYAEGVLLSQKILEIWRDEVEERGGRFIVVLIPTKKEIKHYRPHLRRLKKNLLDKGLEVLDCQPALQAEGGAGFELFLTNKHPSARAHEVIASEVYYYLTAVPEDS